VSRGHSRRVVARRGRRSDQRRHRHDADPTSGTRPEPVPADQLDQLDQLAAVARQQQPTTAPVRPARRRGRPNGRHGGDPAAASRQVAPERPRVDDGFPCACDGDRACLLHYGRR
jgi:hypothetical protein